MDNKEVALLYNSGKSIKQVSIETGISATQIRRILKKEGVQSRSTKTSDNIEQEIISKYSNGISSEKISELLNLNPTTVCRILKRNKRSGNF